MYYMTSRKMSAHSSCQLSASNHLQSVDTLEMGKGSARNGSLLAIAHVQGMDTLEMDKSSIGNGGLIAATHI